MDLLHKPYFEYSLLDSLIILIVGIAAIGIFYGIKIGILYLKLYIHNRRNRK